MPLRGNDLLTHSKLENGVASAVVIFGLWKQTVAL
jgi:hypothetical protein